MKSGGKLQPNASTLDCGNIATSRRWGIAKNRQNCLCDGYFLAESSQYSYTKYPHERFRDQKMSEGDHRLRYQLCLFKRTPHGRLRVETGDCGRFQKALPRPSKES